MIGTVLHTRKLKFSQSENIRRGQMKMYVFFHQMFGLMLLIGVLGSLITHKQFKHASSTLSYQESTKRMGQFFAKVSKTPKIYLALNGCIFQVSWICTTKSRLKNNISKKKTSKKLFSLFAFTRHFWDFIGSFPGMKE